MTNNTRKLAAERTKFLASLSPEDRAFVEASDRQFNTDLDEYLRDWREAIIDKLVESGDVTKEKAETSKHRLALADARRRTRKHPPKKKGKRKR